ncbi:hypothetical protein [Micromonospora narathiwatensis]|uniref:Uncharacterized protein n=1 Tax=Micromonospora narathiwatensis TaxID=299146 RepID=A0A1A9A595_9ACTN|nr:hypothetical protein [Micromonospora narathiwatensis]SBT51631.1 hypothetical protein GA0070621_4126 [Micromonospora narathiwatensis]
MSGRRLGRLFGSLLLFSAMAGVALANGGVADLRLLDFVWV